MDDPRPAALAVDATEVSKRYGTRWALARVSFTLLHGESLLLTGHNGSGKSTLLRLLASASRPSYGVLRVAGHDVTTERDEVRRHVALLSHASFLYEDLSARENLVLVARALGHPRTVADTLLEEMGLGTRASHPVREFSAGMRKRLAVARLLLQEPALALLDEPFGELDPAGITLMERLIRDLQQRGTSVVLATHLVDQGRALCRQRLHLVEGRAVAA
jgi:heme exporter protein A